MERHYVPYIENIKEAEREWTGRVGRLDLAFPINVTVMIYNVRYYVCHIIQLLHD